MMLNSTDDSLDRVEEEQQSSPSTPTAEGGGQHQPELLMELEKEPEDPVVASPTKEEPPQFINYIADLGNLSTAIDNFRRRYEELQKHLEFIEKAIESKLNSKSPSSSPLRIDESEATLIPTDAKETVVKYQTQSIPNKTELEKLCETECSRELRKYVVTHLSDIQRLRLEVPEALKLSSTPGKLVLECVGRFYLQGVKAYAKDSPMVPNRQASVLVLEFFLRMLGNPGKAPEVVNDKSIKEEAMMASIAWKKRLITEGGLSKTNKTDARGLLFMVACYGIPPGFKNDDFKDLIGSSDPMEIADVLRGSRVLAPRIPEMVEVMMKRKMHVEAVDIVFVFGIEDKYRPQILLTSFVKESKEAFKKQIREAHNSATALKHANEMHLRNLKSVVKCLENHKLDSTENLSKSQITELITNLEIDIADLNKRIEDKTITTTKRKTEEMESSDRFKNQDTKRSRYIGKGSSLSAPYINNLHNQRIVSQTVGPRSYESLLQSSVDARYGHSHGHGHVNYLGVVGRMPAGVGVGASYLPAGAYTGPHGEIYGSHHPVGEVTYIDGSIRSSLPSQGIIGLYGNPNSNSSSNLYGFADAVVESEQYNGNVTSSSSTGIVHYPSHHIYN